MQYIILGRNRFTGSISSAHLCNFVYILVLDLSNNNISGVLPECLGNLNRLVVMDLSNNTITGDVPKCLGNLNRLVVMDLSSNTITGDVPSSLGSLVHLLSLHLQNNKFEGILPMTLQNLTSLVTLDLGNNFFTANIPSWIGKNLSKLRILNLQSNKFMGKIPLELCQNNLQHLNLANNNISGMIPHCLYNFTGRNKKNSDDFIHPNPFYDENIMTYVKGIQMKYTKTSRFLTSLDLSSNKIVGEIPEVLMNLVALNNLNLSRNLLRVIPSRIENLKQMESLYFSMNMLSGRIPPGLATLNILTYLNLSFNNLSGPIPFGNQLQILGDPSAIYQGNNDLCGPMILKSCNGNNLPDNDVGVEKVKMRRRIFGCTLAFASASL